jgi:hypothetical protein
LPFYAPGGVPRHWALSPHPLWHLQGLHSLRLALPRFLAHACATTAARPGPAWLGAVAAGRSGILGGDGGEVLCRGIGALRADIAALHR